VIGFGGRVLDNRLPKYINSPESPLYSKARALYGLSEARQAIAKADRAILVEGYIDAISLWQAGFQETVASLGTSLTAEQLRLLSRYTRNIVACFDGDEAGRKASLRALEVFLHAGLLGRGVFIPQGYDPDTLVRQRGAQTFADLLAAAELLVDYFLRQQAQTARESVGARARAAERVADILRMVTNPFEFDILARKAAGILGVGEEVLRNEARRNRAGSAKRTGSDTLAVKTPQRSGALTQAEIGLIAIALRHRELRAEIATTASVQFTDAELAALLEEICASEQSQAILEVMVMARLSDDQRAQLSALLVWPEDERKSTRALAEDYIAALTGGRLRRDVEEELRRAALTMRPDEAIEAAQRVIALRRRPDR
jgi:DNA primase